LEINQVHITGVVAEIRKTRTSPSGVPVSSFIVSHRSHQKEAQQARLVEFEILVQLTGEAFRSVSAELAIGQRVSVKGILAKVSHKQPKSVKLLAEKLEIVG